jgi:magnesium transporter
MSADKHKGQQAFVDEVAQRVTSGDRPWLEESLAELHPSDVADLLESLDDTELQVGLLRALPAELASETLAEMEEAEDAGDLLAALAPQKGAELIQELQDDDAADLIAELEPSERELILAELPAEEAEELKDLLLYGEETAGGLMTTALVSIESSLTADQAIQEVRRQGRAVEDFYTVFVVDREGRLVGTVPLDDLVISDPDKAVGDLAEPPVASVLTDVDQEEVGRLMGHYNLVSIPVLSDQGVLLGRITFDDVLDVMEAEQTEDILRLAGVQDEEEVRGTWAESVRSRLPWLFLNLVTASLAASVILVFEEAIDRYFALAFLMPVIAAMGGNAGTQSLAVTLRRLTLSDHAFSDDAWTAVRKEVAVGLINGAALGTLAAVLGVTLAGEPLLGVVVLLAMWANLAVAGFAGAFVPTLLSRFGVDPAVASSVFVHTFTDLCGFFLLLGLATKLLL